MIVIRIQMQTFLEQSDPNALIRLYNAGIDYLVDRVLQRQELKDMSVPIPELRHAKVWSLSSFEVSC